MTKRVILLSVPGLRPDDISQMPCLSELMSGGGQASLTPSFPCVTWPVQANMLTGKLPAEHGVIANGFFWRDEAKVEMWTAGNEKILQPQIWDLLHDQEYGRTSAVWFPMLSKRCGADYICMPAPIHNPDGSESLWCYTKPTEYYGDLRDALGHFPLQHFWGPMANIKSTDWIIDSAALAVERFQPDFLFAYLPHLDYAAQKLGPNSDAAASAVGELDASIGRLANRLAQIGNSGDEVLWLAASEYVITEVDHVSFPNRMLRDAGLLKWQTREGGEYLDLEASPAWALVDHQFSHVFVRDRDPNCIRRVVEIFQGQPGFSEVLAGADRDRYQMSHERSGDVILISEPNSWQAYYWWQDNAAAPRYAATVDIHQKPGYDPVELHFDPNKKCIPLDASLIKGSHGAPAVDSSQKGVLLASADVIGATHLTDTQIAPLVMRQMKS